jgi:hypothetical protein
MNGRICVTNQVERKPFRFPPTRFIHPCVNERGD